MNEDEGQWSAKTYPPLTLGTPRYSTPIVESHHDTRSGGQLAMHGRSGSADLLTGWPFVADTHHVKRRCQHEGYRLSRSGRCAHPC